MNENNENLSVNFSGDNENMKMEGEEELLSNEPSTIEQMLKKIKIFSFIYLTSLNLTKRFNLVVLTKRLNLNVYLY